MDKKINKKQREIEAAQQFRELKYAGQEGYEDIVKGQRIVLLNMEIKLKEYLDLFMEADKKVAILMQEKSELVKEFNLKNQVETKTENHES